MTLFRYDLSTASVNSILHVLRTSRQIETIRALRPYLRLFVVYSTGESEMFVVEDEILKVVI